MLTRLLRRSTTGSGSILALLAFAVSACSGGSNANGTAENSGLGGSASTGGTSSLAGTSQSVGTGVGGNAATGGSEATGGSSNTDGTKLTGGAASVGGSATSGGSRATGGASTTGGKSTVGGASGTGGSQAIGGAAGGVTAVGGTKAAGGATAAGGAQATGGATAVGGTSSAGGSTAVGGATTVGGAQATGGTSGSGGTSASTGLPALHIEGNLVKDASGKTIILRGVSLIDIGELYANGNMNASGITTRIDKILTAGLKPRVIRLPVYPRTVANGNYPAYSRAPYPLGPTAPSSPGVTRATLTEDDYYSKVLKPAVDYVTTKGMYAIIDYHQIDDTDDATRKSAADANAFWQFMAVKFKDYSNVLYEPYNEPIDMKTDWATFKTRASVWVQTIRGSAPNNIIIVPSMSYCQKPGDAAASPLTDANLMYTAHVYPGNWSKPFPDQVAAAAPLVPLFVTEWGYDVNSTQNPTGTTDASWGTNFRTVLDANGASWTAWVTDNSWTPKIFSDKNLTQLTDFGALTNTWLAAEYGNDWVE